MKEIRRKEEGKMALAKRKKREGRKVVMHGSHMGHATKCHA